MEKIKSTSMLDIPKHSQVHVLGKQKARTECDTKKYLKKYCVKTSLV